MEDCEVLKKVFIIN